MTSSLYTRDATIFGILSNCSIRPVWFRAQRQTTAFSVRFPVTKLFQNSVQPRMLCDPLRSRGMRAAHCLGSPSRTHFSSKVIPELYEVCRGDIENELRQAPYLALSTDSWTSREQRGYTPPFRNPAVPNIDFNSL